MSQFPAASMPQARRCLCARSAPCAGRQARRVSRRGRPRSGSRSAASPGSRRSARTAAALARARRRGGEARAAGTAARVMRARLPRRRATGGVAALSASGSPRAARIPVVPPGSAAVRCGDVPAGGIDRTPRRTAPRPRGRRLRCRARATRRPEPAAWLQGSVGGQRFHPRGLAWRSLTDGASVQPATGPSQPVASSARSARRRAARSRSGALTVFVIAAAIPDLPCPPRRRLRPDDPPGVRARGLGGDRRRPRVRRPASELA